MNTTTTEHINQSGQLRAPSSPWLTVGEAATWAGKLISREDGVAA